MELDGFEVLLAHFTGTDGDRTYTADTGQVATFDAATGHIEDSQYKFSPTCLQLDGNSDFISFPHSADWDFGSGNFKIDLQVRFSSVASTYMLIAQYTAAGVTNRAWGIVYGGNYIIFEYTTDGNTQINLLSAWSPTVDTWYHVCVTKVGTTLRIFINGSKIGADKSLTGTIYNSSAALTIGKQSSVGIEYYFNGFIDEIHISKGGTNYETSNFTPPDSPYCFPQIKTILSDTKIKEENIPQTILSDTYISSPYSNILSDTKIKEEFQKIINSDTKVKVPGVPKNLLSDTFLVTEILFNINNKVNFVKQSLYNISNKISFVKETTTNIKNYFNSAKGSILNILNDFRMRRLNAFNIKNDIRFLRSYQLPGNAGFQSLGKSYIHVYFIIDEIVVEQIDVDIDTMNIDKGINDVWSASFDLARAYDINIPEQETIVEIKYNTWLLYKGKITQINQSENPEHINIICSNKYWDRNRNKVYFHVGHEPLENKPPNVVETYYSTIKLALQEAFSWILNIGNFVPENISCFGAPESDAITSLITQVGNYGWFYDVDENPKLWVAGSGDIINIERQQLEKNLELYNLINHSFKKDISSITNQYRVQMGNITYSGDRKYSGYTYQSYNQYVTPAWDTSLELFASNSDNGEGWDSHAPENNALYSDIFKKYNLPYIDPKLSQWSDEYPPYVEISSPDYSWETMNLFTELTTVQEVLTEGFTIDYENQVIIFNDPKFLYLSDDNGEIISIRAPIIKVFIWKKQFYSYSLDPINNPLTFTTLKMGEYPTTIKQDLMLSNLNKQIGNIAKKYQGVSYQIPAWDDTEFALDYANWQLSKVCDEKAIGDITLTLDAICFFNIDLSKRIYISGITNTPMNILSMRYNFSNFTVDLELQNCRVYQRTISLPWKGE